MGEGGSQCLRGTEFQFGKMEVLGVDGSGGYTTTVTYLTPFTVHLKTVKMVFLMLRILYHNSLKKNRFCTYC